MGYIALRVGVEFGPCFFFRRPPPTPFAAWYRKMPPKNRDSKPLLLENQTQKRRDRAQELRSARRQGVLAKRRKFDAPTATTAAVHGSTWAGAGGVQQQQQQEEEPWSREKLAAAIQGVRERPVAEVLPYLVELRKLLSLEDPPVEEVVEGAGLAPRLMELLSTANDEIQMETTWSVPCSVDGLLIMLILAPVLPAQLVGFV